MTTSPTPSYGSCVLQATALQLTVLLYMKSTATWKLDDDDDDTTDAGEEVVETQTADDPQQNDVC